MHLFRNTLQQLAHATVTPTHLIPNIPRCKGNLHGPARHDAEAGGFPYNYAYRRTMKSMAVLKSADSGIDEGTG